MLDKINKKKNVNVLSCVQKHDVINTKNLHIVTRQGTKIRNDNPCISKIKEQNDYPNLTEHQVARPTGKSIILDHRQEEGEEQIEEDIKSDNPEYDMTKENLRKITKEIAASRKRKAIQEKWKGKRKLIIYELEDKE